MFDLLARPQAKSFTVTLDGEEIVARQGDTVAAILLRTPPHISRTSPVGGGQRAPYCMMGVCFECLAIVDGVASTQSCLVEAQPGMRIERQKGTGA